MSRTRAQSEALQDEQGRDICDIKKTVEHIEKALFVGNGEPSMKEQIHDSQNWIGGANRIFWIIIASAISLVLLLGCSVSLGVIIMLYANGLFKVP